MLLVALQATVLSTCAKYSSSKRPWISRRWPSLRLSCPLYQSLACCCRFSSDTCIELSDVSCRIYVPTTPDIKCPDKSSSCCGAYRVILLSGGPVPSTTCSFWISACFRTVALGRVCSPNLKCHVFRRP